MNTRYYYIILSGEHNTLPLAEVRSILEAERIKYSIVTSLPQVIVLKSENMKYNVFKRAAMVKEVGVLLGSSKCESLEDIVRVAKNIEWNSILKNHTFLVRFKRVRGSLKSISRADAEREVGKVVYESTKRRVDVRNPKSLIRGILVDNRVFLGLKLLAISSRQFQMRRPKARVYFHPTALAPKLSRLFVNLSRVKRGDTLLDPFCGTGGILIEASIIGVQCIGSDINGEMVRGALSNLRHFSLEPVGVVIADASVPPWVRVDAIATDPPYGRASHAKGKLLKNLILDFLTSHYHILKSKGYVVFAIPHEIPVAEVIPRKLYDIVEVHEMRVHKSLTRKIIVIRRK